MDNRSGSAIGHRVLFYSRDYLKEHPVLAPQESTTTTCYDKPIDDTTLNLQ